MGPDLRCVAYGGLVRRASAPEISVVIPVFNEENLSELQTKLTQVLGTTVSSYEIVYVDDGSSDRSVEMIRKYNAKDPRVRLVRLSRNFGHQAALNAGLEHTDRLDPPEERHLCHGPAT